MSRAILVKSCDQVQISRVKPAPDSEGRLVENSTVPIEYLVVTADIIPKYMDIEYVSIGYYSGNEETFHRITIKEYRLDFKDKKVSELYLTALLKLKYSEVENISTKFPEADI